MKYIFSFLLSVAFCTALFSQEILVPYRDGEKWGLSNLKGEVKLAPAYDKVIYDKFESPGYFECIQDKERGLLFGTKLIVAPGSYERFSVVDNRIVIARYTKKLSTEERNSMPFAPKAVKRVELYTNEGKDIFPEKFMDLKHAGSCGYSAKGENLRRLATFWYKDFKGNHGFFQYDADAGKITKWLLKDYYSLEPKSKNSFVAKKSKDAAPETYYFAYINKEYSLYPYSIDDEYEKNPFERPRSGDSDTQIMSSVMLAGEARVLEYTVKSKKIELVETVKDYKTDQPVVKITPIKLDFKPELVEAVPYVLQPFETYDDAGDFAFKNFVRFKYKGKYGFICDKVIVAPQYDSLVQVLDRPEYKDRVYFIAARNDASGRLKFGAISSTGETIVPLIYDDIKWDQRSAARPGKTTIDREWVVRNGNFYGLITADNKSILEIIYDEIVVNSKGIDTFFITKKDGLYGVADNQWEDGYLVAKPLFRLKPKLIEERYQQNEKLFLIGFEDGAEKFMGYGNPDGTLYFKN
jgi:hypothetical protein